MIPAGISLLLSITNPRTVTWTIVTAILVSFNGQALAITRCHSPVKEGAKRHLPVLADSDAASSVVGVRNIRRVATPISHRTPNAIQQGSALPVCLIAPPRCSTDAATRCNVPRSKVVQQRRCYLAARTRTFHASSRPPAWKCMTRQLFDNGQLAELGTRWHNKPCRHVRSPKTNVLVGVSGRHIRPGIPLLYNAAWPLSTGG